MTALRTRYFPPERNFLDAHLTLFHALPGEDLAGISGSLLELASRTPILPARTTEVLDFGGGAAFLMEVKGLPELHSRLRAEWKATPSPQDDRKLRPHVTIQNKVERDTARATQTALRGHPPLSGWGIGLDLWHYLGGPWEMAAQFPFQGERA